MREDIHASELPISPAVFKDSMRLLSGGVCLVTSEFEGVRLGLTITAICSLTADPPSLIICINRDAGAHDMMMKTRRIAINLLASDQKHIAELFSSSSVKGSKRFETGNWIPMASGMPALVDAHAVLDCDLVRDLSVGQHSVFFCEVRAACLRPEKQPLVYYNRKFCSLLPIRE